MDFFLNPILPASGIGNEFYSDQKACRDYLQIFPSNNK